jgi:hypothetical protein
VVAKSPDRQTDHLRRSDGKVGSILWIHAGAWALIDSPPDIYVYSHTNTNTHTHTHTPAPVEREQVDALVVGLLVQQRLHLPHQRLRRRAPRVVSVRMHIAGGQQCARDAHGARWETGKAPQLASGGPFPR